MEFNDGVEDREREQLSRQFGIKLAKALRDRAAATRAEHHLDPRYVMLGAADYLRKAAEFQIDPPVNTAEVDPDARRN